MLPSLYWMLTDCALTLVCFLKYYLCIGRSVLAARLLLIFLIVVFITTLASTLAFLVALASSFAFAALSSTPPNSLAFWFLCVDKNS